MRRIFFAMGMLSCFAGGPAMAADAVPAFQLPTGTFNAPLPDGFCVATGRFEVMAKMLAAADTINLTDITYVDCNDIAAGQGPASSWGMIKTPLETLKARMGQRAAALAQLKASLDADASRKMLDITSDDIATKTNLKKIFGNDFTGSAKFEPLYSDDKGVYFGGIANYDDGKGGTAKVAVAYGVTVVNDSAFAIYLYRPFTDVSDIADLANKVKVETAAFIAANGG
jgi:hypothetical protein